MLYFPEYLENTPFNCIVFYILQIIGGKKPTKGQFNGHAKVFIGKKVNSEKYNYGLKYKKCIKLYSHMVSQISGNFVNDVLEGDVTIHFIDKTVMKAFVHSGKAIRSSVILRKICTWLGLLVNTWQKRNKRIWSLGRIPTHTTRASLL